MKALYSRHWLLLAGTVACIGGAAGSANAVTLPSGYDYDASQTATANADGTPVGQQKLTTVGSVSAAETSPGGTVGPGTASSSGSIAIQPSPKISGKASVTFTTPPAAFNTHDGNYGSNASYNGTLTYYFEIQGPTNSSVAVDAKAVAKYSTTALPSGGNGLGITTLVVTQLDPLGDPVSPRTILDSKTFTIGSFSGPTAAQSDGFTENGTYSLLTNTIYQVGLQVVIAVGIANAGASDPSSPGGAATFLASLDPTFKIASGVADPGQYAFAFSNGIGNTVSATPLPAAFPLFVTALGALGLFGARRERRRI